MGGYYRNAENSSFDRWQSIANSTKSFCEDYDVDFVIPYGTAIQNLRASSLNNEYDLTRDGTHCGYGLAQYTAACCYYESLIAPRSGISVLGNSARIDVSDERSDYPSVNVTDENALIAQKAAYLATKDMYHCQNPESDFDANGDGKVNVANIVVYANDDGVSNVADIMTNVNAIYNFQGHKIDNLQKGVNIVRMNDGKIKKLVKL